LGDWQYPPALWCVVSFMPLWAAGGKVNFLQEHNLSLELPLNARIKKFDPKWNQQRKTKVFVPKLCNEQQMYLFLTGTKKIECIHPSTLKRLEIHDCIHSSTINDLTLLL
jgi:hypothetical protein